MAPASRGGSSSSRGGGRGRVRGRGRVPYNAADEFKEKSTPAARAALLFQQAQLQQHQAAKSQSLARASASSSSASSSSSSARTAQPTSLAATATIAKQEAVQKAAAALSSSASRPRGDGGPQIPVASLIKALTTASPSAGFCYASGSSTTGTLMDTRKAMSLATALLKSGRASIADLESMEKSMLTEVVRWPSSDEGMKGKVGEAEVSKAIAACRRAAVDLDSRSHLPAPSSPGSAASSTNVSPAKGYSWEGKREAGDLQSFLDAQAHASKRRKISQAEERLSREWGNPLVPLDSHGESVRAADVADGVEGDEKALPEYEIPCIVEEAQLRGRTALVNRAPVMTLWTMILLERMGFQRREALSLAQCYVSTTSTARAVTLGLTSASERDKASTVGPRQPHFVLMGVKLPVLQLQKRTSTGDVGEYRAIYDGQVIEPQKAFDYIFRSFYQTLPYVFGALVLLADSYLDPTGSDSDADELHAVAWDLYCDFRPETGGEWGKRARLSCETVLGLRKGVVGKVPPPEDGEKVKGKKKEEEDGERVSMPSTSLSASSLPEPKQELGAITSVDGPTSTGSAPVKREATTS
ncbi:hypothetical protein V8E36_003255 [Tilletia maclaganii]